MRPYLTLFLICLFAQAIKAWDSEELEIFDVVEEINKNFYEFMDISQNATTAEIKRAFRGLSIVLHPDKSSAEDANIQFRNLVSIYEILRDPGKREKYNKVLRDGLPNWKSALYYYRRMRKIGLYEGALIVFVITTIGQYLFAWAAYLEKKYTAEQIIGSKLKKLQKKNKTIDMETILNEIPLPSIKNTLPFQIPMAIWCLPSTIKELFNKANELKEIALEKHRLEAEAAKEREELEKELEEQARLKKEKKENLRKRKQNTKAPEKTEQDLQGYSQIQAREFSNEDQIRPVGQKTTTISGGFWTDDDLVELIRLVKKYPGGSSSRWDTIAETMNRTVQEVTFMAAKMKEQGYRIPGQSPASDSVAENIAAQENQMTFAKKEKVKKVGEKNLIITETNWTQEQQRALEAAIVKYRKNASGDRWQKIANSVPGKTKEECLVRYKYLCELVKTTQKKSLDEEAVAENIESGSAKVEELIEETSTKQNESEQTETIEAIDDNSEAGEGESLDGAPAVEEKTGTKRNKRKERRRRRDFSSDEDSDDVYQYERT